MDAACPALLRDRLRTLPSAAGVVLPALAAAAGDRAGERFLEFFASTSLPKRTPAHLGHPVDLPSEVREAAP